MTGRRSASDRHTLMKKTMTCPDCDRPQSSWVCTSLANVGKGMNNLVGVCPGCGCRFRLARYRVWTLTSLLLVLGPYMLFLAVPSLNTHPPWTGFLPLTGLIPSMYLFPYLCQLDAVKA